MRNSKKEILQWTKAILFVAILFGIFSGSAFAADSTGIQDLDNQASKVQMGLQVFAKWGGIAMIVITGIIIGTGKAQGDTARLLCVLAIAVGLIVAAWGWFLTSFTNGFMF